MSDSLKAAKQIGKTFASGGQPDAAEIQQLSADGFKSIVNLRSPGEAGTLADEQQQAEAAGLEYVNIPLNPSDADDDLTAKVLWELETLPTPIFLHCGAGGRAGALALIALATQQGLNREQIIVKAKELGVSVEQPHLKSFLATLGSLELEVESADQVL